MMFSKFIHCLACVRITFLSLSNNSYVYIAHFVYSFICWWTFGCFPILVTVNNAAMSMEHKYLFKSLLSILLGVYLKVELLDHLEILYLIFWGNTILFCIRAVPSHIPSNSLQGSNFPTSSPTLIFCFVDRNHHDGHEVTELSSFDCDNYTLWVFYRKVISFHFLDKKLV